MNRYLIHVYTNWCGMDQDYVAYANDDLELEELAQQLAFDNFNDFDCLTDIANNLFPEADEITDEMLETASEVEGEYYGYTIKEWDESRSDEEWNWYELVYDGREEI